MPDLNPTALYKEAECACIKPDAVPPEPRRAQTGAMKHKPLTLSERIINARVKLTH